MTDGPEMIPRPDAHFHSAKLSPELVSLVHHVELNRSGWWDLGVQGLCLAALWLSPEGESTTPEAVTARLNDNFGIQLASGIVSSQLAILAEKKTVLCLPSGDYKITELALKTFEGDLKETEELEQSVEAHFLQLLSQHCPILKGRLLWQDFLDQFLMPLVRNLGANTYNLITGTSGTFGTPGIGILVDKFDKEHGESLRLVAAEFLDPSNADVRDYVLRLMNAFFFLQASSLDEKTVQALTSNGKHFTATIFVDTNFIFSLLGLHENPADDAAQSLVGLIVKLGKRFPLKLYVLPPTLDEATKVITRAQAVCLNLRLSANVAEAALESGNLGITEKFMGYAAASKGPVDAREYFAPFLKNLITILRGKGVELFNQDLSSYNTRQDVIDDLLARLQFEKSKYGPRAKTYAELEHDCVIWHFVKDRRQVRTESPVDANYWIVTIDYRYLGFDAYLTHKAESQIPMCLHPADLPPRN